MSLTSTRLRRQRRCVPGDRRIAIVVFDDLQPLDLVGPHEVFTGANSAEERRGRPAPYDVSVVAVAPGPIRTSSGLTLHVDRPLPTEPVDTILVVGGPGACEVRHDERLTGWLRTASRSARRTCSVCTGAFVLASAGILDGRRATTHWSRARQLRREHPRVVVDPEPLFVQDGSV